jgi:hypothetical protein
MLKFLKNIFRSKPEAPIIESVPETATPSAPAPQPEPIRLDIRKELKAAMLEFEEEKARKSLEGVPYNPKYGQAEKYKKMPPKQHMGAVESEDKEMILEQGKLYKVLLGDAYQVKAFPMLAVDSEGVSIGYLLGSELDPGNPPQLKSAQKEYGAFMAKNGNLPVDAAAMKKFFAENPSAAGLLESSRAVNPKGYADKRSIERRRGRPYTRLATQQSRHKTKEGNMTIQLELKRQPVIMSLTRVCQPLVLRRKDRFGGSRRMDIFSFVSAFLGRPRAFMYVSNPFHPAATSRPDLKSLPSSPYGRDSTKAFNSASFFLLIFMALSPFFFVDPEYGYNSRFDAAQGEADTYRAVEQKPEGQPPLFAVKSLFVLVNLDAGVGEDYVGDLHGQPVLAEYLHPFHDIEIEHKFIVYAKIKFVNKKIKGGNYG